MPNPSKKELARRLAAGEPLKKKAGRKPYTEEQKKKVEEYKAKKQRRPVGRPKKFTTDINVYDVECRTAYETFRQVRNLMEDVPNSLYELPITLPNKPENYKKIVNYGLSKKQRKFPYYSQKMVREIDSLDMSDTFTMPDDYCKAHGLKLNSKLTKEEFILQEFERTTNGFWFYNGDNLEFVTRYHYFILQYWLIPNDVKGGITTNPEFVDMIRDRHYAIQNLIDDPNYSGLAFLGCRRSSKSVDGMATGYLDTATRMNGNFTIQSKTEADAEKVFAKLVKSWKKLPSWYKPKDTGDRNPKRGIYFDNTRTRSTKDADKEYEDVLEGVIEPHPSVPEAIDGARTTFQFNDEFGKGKVKVSERQKVNKICCFSGSNIIGFMFWATTVEEMEKKGGAEAKIIWDESNPTRLDDNGRTESTMARLFFPAEYGMFDGTDPKTKLRFIDEWGYSRRDLAAKYLDNAEKGLKGSALIDWRRKFPREWQDCFRTNELNSPFATINLKDQTRYQENNPEKTKLIRGNFEWKDGISFTTVVWRPCSDGRWLISWLPPESMRNAYHLNRITGHYEPKYDICLASLDPFAASKVKDESRASKAASYVITEHADFSEPTVVCEYYYRHDDPNKQYDDILKQCIFYSCPLLTERNKGAILNWIEEKGFEDFLMFDPYSPSEKQIRGVFTDGTNNFETMLQYAQAFVAQYLGGGEHGMFINFPWIDLMNDMLRFDVNNRTEFDRTMAFIIAMTALREKRKMKKMQQENNVRANNWGRNDWI